MIDRTTMTVILGISIHTSHSGISVTIGFIVKEQPTEPVRGGVSDCEWSAYRVRRAIDWGRLKPITPYETWFDAITTSNDLVVIPCARTAPAALALERLYGEHAQFIAVDNQPEARDAFLKRRQLQFDLDEEQSALSTFDDEGVK